MGFISLIYVVYCIVNHEMFTMINSLEVIERIQKLMEEQQLNASAFAEKIGVQRSSISHLLSGRNKPSLDLLVKIESNFEEVSFEWLLKGDENAAPISTQSPTLSQITPGNEIAGVAAYSPKNLAKEEIVSIVHYYADGTFERFSKR